MTEESDSKIHICENKQPEESHNRCGVSAGNDIKYLHIYASAIRGAFYEPGGSAISRNTDNSLYLCYPTHCSKSQLDDFIDYFKPQKTVKFPVDTVKTPSDAYTPFRRERERRRADEANRERIEGARRRLDLG